MSVLLFQVGRSVVAPASPCGSPGSWITNAAGDYRLTAPVRPAGFRDRDVYKIIVIISITPGSGLVKETELDAHTRAGYAE